MLEQFMNLITALSVILQTDHVQVEGELNTLTIIIESKDATVYVEVQSEYMIKNYHIVMRKYNELILKELIEKLEERF